MELITVAVVKFMERGDEPYLYRAPRWELEAGDRVVCEDPSGDKNNKGEYYEEIGEVVALHDVFLDGDEYNFLLQVAGVKELRRIKAEIRRKDFTYPTIEEAEPKESEQEETE
jgi:hypothetical protein